MLVLLISLPHALAALDSEDPLEGFNSLGQLYVSTLSLLVIRFFLTKLKDRLGESQVVAEQLEVLAQTDALMGVLNRGQIESLIEQEMKRSRRYDLPLSLVAFELDDFMQPNGTFGHDARDGMLVKAARLAQPHLRTRDQFGR